MNFPKLAMLSGFAAISLVAAAPAWAAWYTYNGNANSGWSSSGWASSSFGGGTRSSTSSSGTSASSSAAVSSSGGTPVPEPSNMLMLALGVAGLVAGRFAARRKRKK